MTFKTELTSAFLNTLYFVLSFILVIGMHNLNASSIYIYIYMYWFVWIDTEMNHINGWICCFKLKLLICKSIYISDCTFQRLSKCTQMSRLYL